MPFLLGETDMPSETHFSAPSLRKVPSSVPPTDSLELLKDVRHTRRETDTGTTDWSDADLEQIWKSTTD